MIDDIKDYLKDIPENQRLNHLREYLQLVILKVISDSGYKKNITFTGGTALRITQKINRFSEDLDFSLTDKKAYNFEKLLESINRGLNKYGFDFTFGKSKDTTVNSAFIKFNDLLYPLHLSFQKGQKLSVKLDVDTNPPKGADIKEFIYSDRFYFLINYFTLESLFALKLHALLYRVYIKGRDYYDLMFFLNKKIVPKFDLFKNAVKQTDPRDTYQNSKEVFSKLENRIKKMDEKKIKNDLRPFILKPEELNMITKKNLLLFWEQYKEAVGDKI
ncbi:MAG: nucleotidyl transferase AbiEii/AbiGii toxin family protein [Spirochaetes bacterium]|nr:nucleotidyl transferase AbiEii/AbiGii toxin family protein [Spirochaetota bacterium]